MIFTEPPQLLNYEQKPRRIGWELEFSKLGLDEISSIITELYGGNIDKANRYVYMINDTELGAFKVKIDTSILNQEKFKKYVKKVNFNLEDTSNEELENKFGDFLQKMLETVVPYEVVTPPLEIEKLPVLEKLREKMYLANAEGTKSAFTNAFAYHVNPEVYSLEAKENLDVLRAFLLLYHYLVEELEIDFTRKMTSFINPFTGKFAREILKDSYQPGWDQFIDDYYQHNPDRNRPLDFYPLFSFINREKVKGMENIGNVKERPTFHYRLPNSSIEKKDWTLANEWDYWVMVEKLASDKDLLNTLCHEYLEMQKRTILNFRENWIDFLKTEVYG
jgi:hypothetical protein